MSLRLSSQLPSTPAAAAASPALRLRPGARRSHLALALRAALAAAACPLLVLAACSDGVDNDSAASSGSAGAGAGASSGGSGGNGGTPPVVKTLHPDAQPIPPATECTVEITTGITVATATHQALCTPIDYPTNPPSGGPHWGQWAAFKQYTTPVPREMYVHDMEHGAVVLAYQCDGACPEITDFLTEVFEGRPADPLCVASGEVSNRMVMTPDPDLDVPVAAAAWGATYRATCLDKASLQDFVDARYGKGTEQICAQGKDIEADGGVGCPE